MSTVPQWSVTLPSADTMRTTTELVGGLERDGETASALDDPVAAVERGVPAHALAHMVEHRLDGSVAQDGAARLRSAFAQQVLAPELDRLDAERARNHVGMALVGEGELGKTEAAQRAGGSQVGVERV